MKQNFTIFLKKKRDPSHNKCFSMSKLNEMFINAEFNILHTEKIIKKMDFPEWIDRPHIDQNIITELENILLNSSLVLKKWLNPRTEKEKLFFNEIEGVILAEKPNSIK